MSAYSDARTAIVNALKAGGIDATEAAPERATPPLAFLDVDDPYITRDSVVFGGELLHYRVVLAAKAGTNALVSVSMDDLITQAIDALDAPGTFIVGEVGSPGHVPLGGQNYPGVVVRVAVEINRRNP